MEEKIPNWIKAFDTELLDGSKKTTLSFDAPESSLEKFFDLRIKYIKGTVPKEDNFIVYVTNDKPYKEVE